MHDWLKRIKSVRARPTRRAKPFRGCRKWLNTVRPFHAPPTSSSILFLGNSNIVGGPLRRPPSHLISRPNVSAEVDNMLMQASVAAL